MIIKFPKAYRFDTHTHVIGDLGVIDKPKEHYATAQHIAPYVDMFSFSGGSTEEKCALIQWLREKIGKPVLLELDKPIHDESIFVAGVNFIMDSSLTKEPTTKLTDSQTFIAEAVARYNVGYFIQHGASFSSDQLEEQSSWGQKIKETYADHVARELEIIAHAAMACGVNRRQIILTPGLSHFKSPMQNFNLLNHFSRIKALGYAVMIDVRKAHELIELQTSTQQSEEMIAGTVSSLAAIKGAHLIRLPHAVAQAVYPALKFIDAVGGIKGPEGGW